MRWPSRVPKLPGVEGKDEQRMSKWLRDHPGAKRTLAKILEPYFVDARFRALRVELEQFQADQDRNPRLQGSATAERALAQTLNNILAHGRMFTEDKRSELRRMWDGVQGARFRKLKAELKKFQDERGGAPRQHRGGAAERALWSRVNDALKHDR
eukprot:8855796-Karenia_brevis.AAC.1